MFDSFASQISLGPFEAAWALLALPPDRLGAAMGFLAALLAVCELVRISLATEHTRSVLAHVLVCLFTFAFQSLLLAVVLVHAAATYPERAWLNLALVLALYGVWYLTGQLTLLVRSRSEGADLGFMAVGALLTFPVGIVAALAVR